ncbi:sensor domain-containing diguanylate cyclase [Cognatilysobacter tabacisoli]|uniref:sensor domain-containing diguanylate cyclase n=1 Tax=Cognatilysobacter tabacisoli TaxID=2315424 RepID=UPI000E6B45C9|nr:diguanylate cyclase [Lysobacter tabacisoli]
MGVWRTVWATVLGGALALAGLPAHAQTPVELTRAASQVPLSPHVRYLHDPGGRMDLVDIDQRLAQGGFAPLPGGSSSFGFQAGAFWFHVPLVNRASDQPRWLLVQQYALSDQIDTYVRYGDGRIAHQAGGDTLPFSARSIRYRHPNFQLDLPYDTPVDLFVRVESQSSMQVPLVLYTPSAFAELARDAQFGIGLYYGILIALFFYNLVLWLTLRDASYFWYLLHISAFGLVLFTLNGLGFEYLWPNSAWLADKSVPLSICLAQVGMQQFARVFLDLGTRWTLGDRVGMGFIVFFVLLGVASIWLPYELSTPIAAAAVFISITWIAIAAVVTMRRGYKPARLFLLAWAMFLLGTGMFTAVAFGAVPKNFVTEYGVQMGSALEMLLLSVALSYRYAALRTENERIVREAKLQLEHKVEQRTSELRSALAQLGDAHARLRETSQRDGLTGLHTRKYFHEAFEPLLEQSRHTGRPLAVLMIDLDHFKAINDRYGHLAGDECLRAAAHAIGQALRPHQALLARFGGEEFVAALPGADLARAAQIAEQVRAAVAGAPCDCGEQVVSMSVSIGVHALGAGSKDGIDVAFKQADQALYHAKADGRDRVRTSGAVPA